MGPRQHLLDMTKVGHHGDNVILYITQVEANIATGSNLEVLVAALGEALDDVRLGAQEPHRV